MSAGSRVSRPKPLQHGLKDVLLRRTAAQRSVELRAVGAALPHPRSHLRKARHTVVPVCVVPDAAAGHGRGQPLDQGLQLGVAFESAAAPVPGGEVAGLGGRVGGVAEAGRVGLDKLTADKGLSVLLLPRPPRPADGVEGYNVDVPAALLVERATPQASFRRRACEGEVLPVAAVAAVLQCSDYEDRLVGLHLLHEEATDHALGARQEADLLLRQAASQDASTDEAVGEVGLQGTVRLLDAAGGKLESAKGSAASRRPSPEGPLLDPEFPWCSTARKAHKLLIQEGAASPRKLAQKVQHASGLLGAVLAT
mmetsp:Transcript_59682/g.187156  ORF Transcript_59682/g.187156 Transcript_59682/m.187156 type:complete len:310 (+) Transcript_59682:51-980(+)